MTVETVQQNTVTDSSGKKKGSSLKRLLWGSGGSTRSRQVGSTRHGKIIETAFLPDTSLVLEERKHQILNRDKYRTKDLPPRCPSAPPCSHYGVVNVLRNAPTGRAASPMGRVPSPMGRVPSPMARSPSPLVSPTPSPSLSTTSSRTTSSPTYYCTSPVMESSNHSLRSLRNSPVSGLYANSSSLILQPNHTSTPRRVSFRPLPPLPPPRHPSSGKNHVSPSKEDWSDGKSRNSSSDQPDRRSGSRSGGRRDDPRRHTLGGPQDPQHFQQMPRQTMDLESPLGSRGYGIAPSNPMLIDDDPGIMSEVETSSTGFRRGNKQRSSLPVVRTPSKTLERPLGLVFLQYRGETKRALLPNEITSIDTVKALFVRSFPKQLTMEYMDSSHVKIYIHDSSKDMFYELEDIRSHLRDIRDRSVLRLFESSDVAGPGATWDQDQSYFSEPEFDSDYQHQHIHKTKGSKGGGYYMTHSYPPGGGVPRGAGAGPLLRNTVTALGPPYTQQSAQTSPNSQSNKSQDRSGRGYGSGYGSGGSGGGSSFEDPYYAGYPPRAGTITPVIDEEASDTEAIEDAYGGYSVRRHMHPSPASLPPYDATRMRVEHMERQLANLTGLVHKALSAGGPGPVSLAPVPPSRLQPPELVQVPPTPTTPVPAASLPAAATHPFRSHSGKGIGSPVSIIRSPNHPIYKSVSFEKSVSFSDEPPDMNSPKQHSPQHSADSKPTKPAIKSSTLPRMSSQDRDRHKPTPPPKPVALSPGQYESRNVYRDLQLTAEMYNHLRSLQKKAKELKCEVRTLRRMCQTQAHTVRETIKDAYLNIRAMLVATSGEVWARGDEASETRMKSMREEELYRQQMIKLENDLTELESSVEELRGNVINRKTRVNMSDVENMALVLSKSSKTVAELKLRFPSLQDSIKAVIAQEMDRAVAEEKFLKEEPERLESALRRCKKLTGTLVTLKRLASVQEQRLPDARLSPPLTETEPPVTPTSNKSYKTSTKMK